MEEYLEMISVPAIAVIVYFVVAVIKYAVKENETFKRFIPLISAGLGVALGIVAYFAVPQIMPAENVFVAVNYRWRQRPFRYGRASDFQTDEQAQRR